MTGDEFKSWRKGVKMTQPEAADALGVAVITIKRSELKGDELIAPTLHAAWATFTNAPAAQASAQAQEAPPVEQKPAPKAKAAKAAPAAPEIDPRRLRQPYDFASAPAHTIGLEREPESNDAFKASTVWDTRPCGEGFQRIPGCVRVVSDKIPSPLPFKAPAWAGWRGVVTQSGAVYDYEAGHCMNDPHGVGAVPIVRDTAPFQRPEKKAKPGGR